MRMVTLILMLQLLSNTRGQYNTATMLEKKPEDRQLDPDIPTMLRTMDERLLNMERTLEELKGKQTSININVSGTDISINTDTPEDKLTAETMVEQIVILDGCVPHVYNGLERIPVPTCEASSVSWIPDPDSDYDDFYVESSCEFAFNHNYEEFGHWLSESNVGVGEWIQAEFDSPDDVKEVLIEQYDCELCEAAGVKKVELEMDGDIKVMAELTEMESSYNWNVVRLSKAVTTSTLKITIKEVETGKNNGFRRIGIYGDIDKLTAETMVEPIMTEDKVVPPVRNGLEWIDVQRCDESSVFVGYEYDDDDDDEYDDDDDDEYDDDDDDEYDDDDDDEYDDDDDDDVYEYYDDKRAGTWGCGHAFNGILEDYGQWLSESNVGVGEWIQAEFDSPVDVKEVLIEQYDCDTVSVKKVELEMDGDIKVMAELTEMKGNNWNVIRLSKAVTTSTLKITIKEVETGHNNGFRRIAIYGENW